MLFNPTFTKNLGTGETINLTDGSTAPAAPAVPETPTDTAPKASMLLVFVSEGMDSGSGSLEYTDRFSYVSLGDKPEPTETDIRTIMYSMSPTASRLYKNAGGVNPDSGNPFWWYISVLWNVFAGNQNDWLKTADMLAISAPDSRFQKKPISVPG